MPKITTTKICVSVGVKRVKLKYWNTSKKAFAEYKTVKEKIIKEYAVPPPPGVVFKNATKNSCKIKLSGI